MLLGRICVLEGHKVHVEGQGVVYVVEHGVHAQGQGVCMLRCTRCTVDVRVEGHDVRDGGPPRAPLVVTSLLSERTTRAEQSGGQLLTTPCYFCSQAR